MIVQIEGVWRWHAPSQRPLDEMSWATEVGDVRAELGEIEKCYQDYAQLLARMQGVDDQTGQAAFTTVRRRLEKGLALVVAAEAEFRQITNSPKAPRRNAIKQTALSSDLRTELVRISTDIGKLSVRVRNIGQDTAHFKVLKVDHVRQTFEQASEIIRRSFVAFEKAMGAYV